MSDMIRVLIADDHAIVREGLRSLISTEYGMAVAGEAANGREAVTQFRILHPDVVLMDLVMPEMDGIQAIKEIIRLDPRARILALTSFSDDDKVFPAIKAGALGYLLKDSSPQELLRAIRHVYQGESSLDPTIALKVIREIKHAAHAPMQPDALSEREVEVLKLVAQGLSNQEIATALVISERTVRNHMGSILSKLHLANRTQAAIYALRTGLASLDVSE